MVKRLLHGLRPGFVPPRKPLFCFATPEPQPQTPVGDSFQLHAITQTLGTQTLGMGKGDDTSLKSPLVSSIFHYNCSCILMFLDGSGSLSSPARRNAFCFLMTPSQ
jgi:hypothetical protein